MLEWECLFSGSSFEELVEADEPRVVADQDHDGCMVFALSDRLLSALRAAGEPEISEVAGLWSQLRERDGEAIGVDLAGEIPGDLTRLARVAEGQAGGVYCWVA
ncbi:hypothetical protein ACFWVP_03890 [Streptomyces sp. NPDC058637]|uniref:hypothetical protein n=1 Tax=Streptomyces sp. NPDC058637 TaxID=3346569 RepID=UPI0036468381